MQRPFGKGRIYPSAFKLLLTCTLPFFLPALASFGQTYLITDTGPISTCSGTLYDSGGESGDYSDNEDNILTIYSGNGDALIAEIAEFDTQWPDRLRIYDGPDVSSPLLAELTISVTGTPSYLSSGDCLTFEFISNTGSIDPGFRINLSCTPLVTGYLISDGGPLSLCSGNIFDSGGVTGDYGPDEDNQITIYSADGRSVEMDLLSLDLGGGDYLEIYDGPNTSGTLLADLSSTSSPGIYTSSGTSLTLHFTSDNSFGEGGGFAASISCVPVTIGYLISDGGTVSSCSGRIYDTGGQGGDYSRSENYTMSFCSDDGSAVVLDFSAFEYVNGDYFNLFDGPDITSPQIANITNSNSIPGPFTSSGSCLTLQSVTNADAAVGDGFFASFSCAPVLPGYLISDEGSVSTCGANFYDSGGQGQNYGSSDDYTMTFCSDDGSPMEVDFGSIDIRDGDTLFIYDGSTTSNLLLAMFTSTTSVQGPFTSSGTCLTFRFTADGGPAGNGFAAAISCVDPCEGLPVLTFGPVADVCENAPAFDLNQASPSGGTYSGTGITGSPEFDPSVAGAGIHSITYTLTDINGCTNSIDQTVTVLAGQGPTGDIVSGSSLNRR